MDGIVKRTIRCPQCSNLASYTGNDLTDDFVITCPYCGYQKVGDNEGSTEYKGYGALLLNDVLTQYHQPISYEEEKNILHMIDRNENAQFFKYNEKTGITVVKGQIDDDLSDDEKEILEKENNRLDGYYDCYYTNY